MNNEGIVLDPEIDEVLDSEHDPNNPANRDYFANAANEDSINRLLAGAQLDSDEQRSDSDFDDGASEFETRGKRMTSLLTDDGVKKKVGF